MKLWSAYLAIAFYQYHLGMYGQADLCERRNTPALMKITAVPLDSPLRVADKRKRK